MLLGQEQWCSVLPLLAEVVVVGEVAAVLVAAGFGSQHEVEIQQVVDAGGTVAWMDHEILVP